MKNKGFTLIELLAVIVILAIIALIATPTILGVIEKARKGASEQSALGYIDAVEKQVAINQVKNENLINDGTYNVPMNGITVKGEAPTKGWLKIEKGLVTNYSFVMGKYVVTKGSETIKGDKPTTNTDSVKKYTVYNNGTAVYYNPETNTKCESSEATSTTGTKTGCMKWYTFNDEGENSSTVNMILDHDTMPTVAYNSTGVNNQMKELLDTLADNTKNWKVSARLITADEVAKITNNTSFNSLTTNYADWFCFDTNQKDETNFCQMEQGKSKYYWLFDYTDGCEPYGCKVSDSSSYGYWVNTPSYGKSDYAWSINRMGTLNSNDVRRSDYGLRPVISVSKEQIK